MSEMQLNPPNGPYDKQDCESKAFHRLLPRLKEAFPQQPIVHLLDGEYGNGPMCHALDAVHHKFLCAFKPGLIPTLYPEALTLQALNPRNRLTQTLGPKRRPTVRVSTWVNDLECQGLRLDFVMGQETVDGHTTTFARLTNFRVDRDHVIIIAQGGRQRFQSRFARAPT